nr:MAG: replication initiation protein [Microvirus sp.]
MACFAPLRGYRSLQRNEAGKREIVFSYRKGYHDLPIELPCGQCIGCRMEKTRQWAMRCMHEASMYERNVFITLTYDELHLPRYGSLRKEDFQLFMKRLRKEIAPERVRFFHSGEYGSDTMRPHYHALLFGYDFADKLQWSVRGKYPVYRSAQLERLWGLGHSELGVVSFDSAAYVAKYCIKKLNGQEAEERYVRLDTETGVLVPVEAEYATMSRRPGIGAAFYARHGETIHRHDSVVMNGQEMKPPKFYDSLAEVERPDALRLAKARRRSGVDLEEQAPHRLTVREIVATAKFNLYGKDGDL